MGFASAADLPPEVIDQIVSVFKHAKSRSLLWYTELIGADTRQLGILSLICRHWARRCRIHLFEEITLLNRNDFFRFLNLADSPIQIHPPILKCTKHLSLVSTGPWFEPWLHLVHAEITRRRESFGTEQLEEYGVSFRLDKAFIPPTDALPESQLSGGYAPHSWCTGLPKSLPAAMFPVFRMELSNLHFYSPSALIRLIRSTPLRQLHCTDLQFDDWSQIASQTRGRWRQVTNRLFEVSTYRCGSPSQNLDLLLLIARSFIPYSDRKPVMSWFNGWYSFHDIARSMLQTDSTKVDLVLWPFDKFEDFIEDMCTIHLKFPLSDNRSSNDYTHRFSLTIQRPPTKATTFVLPDIDDFDHEKYLAELPPKDPTFFEVTSPELNLGESCTVDQAKHMDWTAIEAAVLQIRATSPLKLVAKGLDTFLWLLNAIPAGQVLPQLRRAGKLVVMHRDQPNITLESILSTPITHSIDGGSTTLTRRQIVQLAYCKTQEEREVFLRGALAANSGQATVQSEEATS